MNEQKTISVLLKQKTNKQKKDKKRILKTGSHHFQSMKTVLIKEMSDFSLRNHK